MSETKISLKERITKSIGTIKKIVSPKQKVKKTTPAKDKKPILTIANINKVRKIVSNPLVMTIGKNLIELASPKSINIYTHNICWKESKANHARINTKIQSLEPDIICLQEVVFQSQLEIFAIPKYYKSIAQSSSSRVVKGGLAILSKKDPLSVNFIKFENQGKIFSPQLSERSLEKGFLIAEFEDFLIINTHLVADHSKKWNEKKLKFTKNQFAQMLKFVSDMKSTKEIFITGDFNFVPDNEAYKSIAMNNFFDLTTKIPYTYIGKRVKLDYIISSKQVKRYKTTKIRFTNQEPSDHLALFSQIVY